VPADASAQLHAIAAKLKVTGDRGLKTELTRSLRAAAQPLVTAVKDAAIEKLPHGGGLNLQVASQRVTVSVLTSARNAGVRMRTTAPDTKMTDSGFVRHPLPGNNRSQWITQQIPEAAGWWSATLAASAPAVTPALVAVMQSVSAEIEAV
jgi:hypothetical protein